MRIPKAHISLLLFPFSQSDAEQFDKVAVSDIESAASFEEAKSFDEVVVMRFSETHEPQMVEITNPLHKILVARVKWTSTLAFYPLDTFSGCFI